MLLESGHLSKCPFAPCRLLLLVIVVGFGLVRGALKPCTLLVLSRNFFTISMVFGFWSSLSVPSNLLVFALSKVIGLVVRRTLRGKGVDMNSKKEPQQDNYDEAHD